MSAMELLRTLEARGVTLVVVGDQIKLRGKPGSWADLRDRLRAAKAELIAALTPLPDRNASRWQDYFNERAAIAEFDAHRPRKSAERFAYLLCRLEYSRQNPPPDPGDARCIHCGDIVTEADAKKLIRREGERNVHLKCEDALADHLRVTAGAALAVMGIVCPETS